MCCKLQVVPTLDAFASQRCHQLPRFMTWDTEDRALAVNALVQQWDQVTWLFPPVPLILEVLRIVEEQQIEAVLICLGWKGTSWWPQLSELRKQVPIRLPPAARCCQYPRGSAQSLPKLDPLIAVHISARPSTLAPDVLDEEDHDFPSFHIRKGTKQNYCGGWRRFSEFCNKRMIEPMVAPMATIVKFIVQMFKANLKY